MSSQWFMRQGRPSVEPGASTLASSCAISLDRLHVHHRCSLLRFCSVSFSRACFYVRKNRASCCAFRRFGLLLESLLAAPQPPLLDCSEMCLRSFAVAPKINLGMARLPKPKPQAPHELRIPSLRNAGRVRRPHGHRHGQVLRGNALPSVP